jgi:peptidyl-prolyl cis-trans isomerase B (cyclophilin B)
MSEAVLTKGQINTNKGVLTFELYDDDAPIAVANFKKLVNQGFYNGLSFHRVIPNFMIQGGCPNGTGAGGPGYTIQCETKGAKQHHDRGVMSMAHRGPNTGGSQFFICHNRTNTQHLDGVHTCFGKIIDGLDIIDDIRGGDVMEKITLLS